MQVHAAPVGYASDGVAGKAGHGMAGTASALGPRRKEDEEARH